MQPNAVDQIVGAYRAGKQVDRGRVVHVETTAEGGQIVQIDWSGGYRLADDIRVLHRAEMFLAFLDLGDITEQNFRGGPQHRQTGFPWSISSAHKEALREQLEARGFDVSEDIQAQEKPNVDSFFLTQEFPLP